jgi:hypothetical protein
MNRDKVYITFIYVLSPFLAFLFSFTGKDRKLIKYSIALFSIWIGLSVSIASGSNGDILRYQESYEFFRLNTYSIGWLLDQMYVTDGYSDVFAIFTTFIFVNLGFKFEIYLGFLGLIFSIFYSKFIFQLLDVSGKMAIHKKVIFIFALLVIPVWYGINNIRFTLVTMIFVTSIYDLAIHKNTRINILLICLTPLIHFSVYWVPMLIFVIFKLSNFLNPKILLFAFIVLAILPSNFIINSVNLSSYIPSIHEDRSSAYVDTDNISNKIEKLTEASESLSFHAKFLSWPYNTIFYVLPIILGLTLIGKNSRIEKEDLILLKWILLFGSIAAILSAFPSGGRFKAFVILPAIIMLFRHWGLVLKHYRPVILILVFMMILYNIVKLRTALDSFSVTTIIGNPIMLFYTDIESRTSLIDIIK